MHSQARKSCHPTQILPVRLPLPPTEGPHPVGRYPQRRKELVWELLLFQLLVWLVYVNFHPHHQYKTLPVLTSSSRQRGKHLKCDGVNPCSRCVSSGSDCVYVASRRGYKGPRRNPAQKVAKRPSASPGRSRAPSRSGDGATSTGPTHSPFLGTTNSPSLGSSIFLSPRTGDDAWYSPLSTPFLDPTLATSSSMETDMSFFQPYDTADSSNDLFNLFATQVPTPTLAERCIDYFYNYFHAGHPIVPPRETFISLAHETTLKPLAAVMRWVGSLYIPACPNRGQLFQEAHKSVYRIDRRKDGFLVQALLLLLIGLDGQGLHEKSREILSEVEQIAIEIGLNTRSFASIHGRGMPVIEESWRRTWWELFIVDGLIAGIHKKTNFLLFDFASDVALPCEEYQYLLEVDFAPSMSLCHIH